MKYLILILSFVSITAHAKATRILLEYDFGNQITRSGLTVLSNGLIMKTETLQGKTTYLTDRQLSPAELTKLVKNIDAAALAEPFRNDDIVAAMGGSYGDAKMYTSNGFISFLYTIVGGDGLKKTVLCQQGSEADAIRNWIQKNVRDQMPIDLVPCK
jgi:hypothetical protein